MKKEKGILVHRFKVGEYFVTPIDENGVSTKEFLPVHSDSIEFAKAASRGDRVTFIRGVDCENKECKGECKECNSMKQFARKVHYEIILETPNKGEVVFKSMPNKELWILVFLLIPALLFVSITNTDEEVSQIFKESWPRILACLACVIISGMAIGELFYRWFKKITQ